MRRCNSIARMEAPMRALVTLAASLLACANPETVAASGPENLRVEFIRRTVSETVEGVVTADTPLDSVDLVEPTNTTHLPGFSLGGNRPFSLSVAGLREGEHPLVIKGNRNSHSTELSTSFTVDRTHPGLASPLPTKLTLGDSILLRFSEPVALETVDKALRVQGIDSWSWSAVDEVSIRVALEWGFRAPGVVRVTIGSGLTDWAGLGLVAQVDHRIEFVDPPDAGELVWESSLVYFEPVTTLQPRSAFLRCLSVPNTNRLVQQLLFVDGGVQSTELSVSGTSSAVSVCKTVASGSEVFFLQLAYNSIDVLSGSRDGAKSFTQIGPSIPFVVRLGQPSLPSAARLPDGRVLASDGTRPDPLFWLFDGRGWNTVPGPPSVRWLRSLLSLQDSVVAVGSTLEALAPLKFWAWRNDTWVEVGAAPFNSSCCVSTNRLLCLNSDRTMSEIDGGVIGRASGTTQGSFLVRATVCDEQRAVWALEDDIIGFNGEAVTTWSLARRLSTKLWVFPDGTTWVDVGTRMFRAAKH